MSTKKIIRFCYRKVIDASLQGQWEKLVFEGSYKEFLLQAQYYNQEKKYSTFAELVANVPNAEKLHFLVSAAVVGYVMQLGGKIPDIRNNLDRHFLKFKQYQFEIINSDIKSKPAHKVAVNFFSEPLVWFNSIGEYMLVAPANASATEDGMLTELVKIQPFLNVYSLKEEE